MSAKQQEKSLPDPAGASLASDGGRGARLIREKGGHSPPPRQPCLRFLFTHSKSFHCNLKRQRPKGTPGAALALDLIKYL